MSLVISVPPELEEALLDESRRQGTTPELVALDTLRRRFLTTGEMDLPAGDQTLAEFLGEYIGVLHSSEVVEGGARMSENPGMQFAEGMAQKRREGRL